MVSIPILSNTSLSTADLESEGSVAKVKSALLKEWLRTVRSEERSKLLKRLLVEGLGTNDVEDFMAGQDDLKFNVGGEGEGMRDEKEIGNLMENKLTNSLKHEKQCRKDRGRIRSRLENLLKSKKNEYKKFINQVREKVAKERKKIQDKNKTKIRFIRMERKECKQTAHEQQQINFLKNKIKLSIQIKTF